MVERRLRLKAPAPPPIAGGAGELTTEDATRLERWPDFDASIGIVEHRPDVARSTSRCSTPAKLRRLLPRRRQRSESSEGSLAPRASLARGQSGGRPFAAACQMTGPWRGYRYVVAVLANIDPPAAQRIAEYLDRLLPTER
jgi:hypothetical protein